MTRFSGRITEKETRAPVADVVVGAVKLPDDDGGSPVSLGSAATDAKGNFTIVGQLSDGVATARVSIVVSPPDTSPEGPVIDFASAIATPSTASRLLVTEPREVAADAHEDFRLLIDAETLEAAGVLPPEASAAGDRLSERTQRTVDEAARAEQEVGAALTARVTADRVLEDSFAEGFLPGFLANAAATSGAVISPDYDFVVGSQDDKAPAALSRQAIRRGISRLQSERQSATSAAATSGRRRTRFFFSDEQLQALDAATGGSGSAGQFQQISQSQLFQILGIDERIATSGGPVELTREEELFDAFLEETREERCVRDILEEPTQPSPSTPPPPDTPEEPADTEDVLLGLGRTIRDVRSPLSALTGDASGTGLAATIRDFAIPVGPADKPRIFDFASLDVAFDDVWQTVIDKRLEPLARSLHVQANRVLKDTVFDPEELKEYSTLVKALDTVRAATRSAAPSVVDLGSLRLGPKGDPIDPLPQVPIPPPPLPPTRPDRPDRPQFPEGEVYVPPANDGGYADPDAAPEELVEQLNAIRREPHAFTAFGADERSKAINFGLLVGYRHTMTPVTYQVGDLVKSVTLAPNETREYKTRTVITRKRSEKELMKHSAIRRDELSDTSRTESEIVRKALAKTNFSLNSEGSYNIGLSKGTARTSASRDGETASNDTKKSFREAVTKASEEVRQERSIEVSFDESLEFERTTTGKLENQNNELTLTCLFFELQRRFRVTENIQKATPVVLVAQDVPSPDEITNAFLVRHAWVIGRVLLDDGFAPALEYVQGQIVGDRLEVIDLAKTLASHRKQVRQLTTQLEALEEQAGRRYEALVQAVKERIAEEEREERDSFFADLGESLFGGGEATGSAKLREEAARDAEQRAADKAKKMAIQLQRAVNALNEATEAYNKANRRYQSMDLEVARLRVHVKEHILHYMQAIWAHEVEEQRFLRLYQVQVPTFAHQGETEPVYRRLGEAAGVTRVSVTPAGSDGAVVAQRRTAVDFELVPSIDVLPEEFDRPLVEVADLSRLLGFFCNYLIFPMRESNALTDLMLNPYLDEGLRLLDPHDPGNISRPQFAEYVCRLRERLSDEEFDQIRDALTARYRELLLSNEYAGDEIMCPPERCTLRPCPEPSPCSRTSSWLIAPLTW